MGNLKPLPSLPNAIWLKYYADSGAFLQERQ